MTKIIDKLSLEGKISQIHAQEIEDIIQEKLFNRYTKGLDAGLVEQKRQILDKIRILKQEYANTQVDERANAWEWLSRLEKIIKL